MSQFASLLFLAFILKMGLVGFVFQIFQRRHQDTLENLVSAWIFIQIGMVAWMLLLSCFHALTPWGLWAGLLSAGILLGIYVVIDERRYSAVSVPSKQEEVFLGTSNLLAIVAMAGVFIFLVYRSLYFFDTTWDALTYELPRISFYAHYQTLFVHQATQAINIFSDEWNGELNALFYVLATNNDQGSSFGNVEIWLVCGLAFSWVARLLGARKELVFVYGFIISTLPCLLGLAMTVKGDLLAIGALAIAFGFALKYFRNALSSRVFLVALGAQALAAGAKIITVPAMLLLGAMVLLAMLRDGGKTGLQKIGIILLGASIYCIGVSRYIVNIFVYGNPFERVSIEKIGFSISYALDNLLNLFLGLFPSYQDIFPVWINVLVLSCGVFFLGLLFCAFIFLCSRKKAWGSDFLNFLPPTFIIFIFLASFVLALSSMPWAVYSYRYFYPWVSMLFLMAIVYFSPIFSFRGISRFTIFWLVLGALNVLAVFCPLGEGRPTPFPAAIHASEMDRKIAYHSYIFGGVYTLDKVGIVSQAEKSILILNDLNSAIYPFFGIDQKNKMQLVSSIASAELKMHFSHYDFVIYSGQKPPLGFGAFLLAHNYALVEKDEPFGQVYAAVQKDVAS